jgi:hypothetical protein
MKIKKKIENNLNINIMFGNNTDLVKEYNTQNHKIDHK